MKNNDSIFTLLSCIFFFCNCCSAENVIIDQIDSYEKVESDEKKDNMKAIVIGATGAVGRDLIQQLHSDENFESVEIFSIILFLPLIFKYFFAINESFSFKSTYIQN